jgi:hypothetical protein
VSEVHALKPIGIEISDRVKLYCMEMEANNYNDVQTTGSTITEKIEDLSEEIEEYLRHNPSIEADQQVHRWRRTSAFHDDEELTLGKLRNIYKQIQDDNNIPESPTSTDYFTAEETSEYRSVSPCIRPQRPPTTTPYRRPQRPPTMTFRAPIYNNRMEFTGQYRDYPDVSQREYNFLQYCHQECPELARLTFKREEDDMRRIALKIMTTDPQGGKTRAYMFLTAMAIDAGFTIVIIVMLDGEQYNQLINSLREFYDTLLQAGVEYNFTAPLMVPVSLKNTDYEAEAAMVNRFARGGGLYIGMDSVTQLEPLAKLIDDFKPDEIGEFIFIYDESDTTVKRKPSQLSKRDKMRYRILRRSLFVLAITATADSHFLGEGDLIYRSDVIKLRLPDDYVGVNHLLPGVVNPKLVAFVVNPNGDHKVGRVYENNIFEMSQWFRDGVNFWMALPPRVTGEPHSLLVKISTLVANHRATQETLIVEYPKSPSLVVNGDAMELYLPDYLPGLGHWFPKTKYSRRRYVHSWDKACYSELKTKILNIYPDRSQPFFEIGGGRFNRGLRPKTAEHSWSPSAEIYMDRDDLEFAAAIQGVRIQGTRGNDTDVKYLITSPPILNTLVHGYTQYDKRMMNEGFGTASDMIREVPLTQQESEVRLTKQFSVRDQKAKGMVFRRLVVEDDDVEPGVLISEPLEGTVRARQYTIIVTELENRQGMWVPLKELRSLVSGQINLQDHVGVDPTMATHGLTFRQLGGVNTRIDYRYISIN